MKEMSRKMKIKEMSNEKLKRMYESYDESINKIGCFSVKDLQIHMALENEILDRDGIILERTKRVVIKK